jgi:hypothetical protein
MEGQLSKQQDTWEKLFTKYRILDVINKSGFFEITSANFKSLHLEPRLLTKFDHSFQLPEIMIKESLSILPTSNSTWRIGFYQSFMKLPPQDESLENCVKKNLPDWLESLNSAMLTGEGAVLNAAGVSGILEDFCESEMVSTITGKGRSGNFSFEIENKFGKRESISVLSSQIEVDGGFEGRKSLHLFEVKKRYATDINMRQLYYPLRAWSGRVKKPIATIYMTYVGNIFTLFQYEFSEINNYSSATLVKTKKYLLADELPTKKELLEVAERSSANPSTISRSVPFPQADSVDRILELLEFLAIEPKTVAEIASEYEFDQRQSDYYFNALKFLGLAKTTENDEGTPQRELTLLGEEIVSKPFKQKIIGLATQMTQVSPIAKVFIRSLKEKKDPSLDDAKRELSNSVYGKKLSDVTIARRSQTIISWAKWLLSIPEIDR